MKAELNLTPSELKRGASRFILRFHVILYTVIVVGGLSTVIFFVYQTVAQSTDTPSNPAVATTNFDQDTIKELKDLSQKSGGGSKLSFPTNQRINPFVD